MLSCQANVKTYFFILQFLSVTRETWQESCFCITQRQRVSQHCCASSMFMFLTTSKLCHIRRGRMRLFILFWPLNVLYFCFDLIIPSFSLLQHPWLWSQRWLSLSSTLGMVSSFTSRLCQWSGVGLGLFRILSSKGKVSPEVKTIPKNGSDLLVFREICSFG